jgi:exosortase A-associated hydrolase 1
MPRDRLHDVGIVVVVGGPQYRAGSHRQFVSTARHLAAMGYPVLRFDCRGMGDSEGSFPGFDSLDDDIEAATQVLLASVPTLHSVVLFGLCDAASACLIYLLRRNNCIRGLIIANPWVHTETVAAKTVMRHYYLQRILQRSFWQSLFQGDFNPMKSMRDLLGNLRLSLISASTNVTPTPSFVERMLAGFAAFERPVLLLISGRDLTAQEFTLFSSSDIAWSRALARQNVETQVLRDADHTFAGRSSQVLANESCAAWLAKLDAPQTNRRV